MMKMSQAIECAKSVLVLAEKIADKAFALQSNLGRLSGMFLARASQCLYSTTLLAPQGMNGDSLTVARTIVEMDIDYAYITTSSEDLIKRFVDYDDVFKFKLATAISNLLSGEVDQAALVKKKAQHDSFKENNQGSTSNWAGKSLKDRAQIADSLPRREALIDGKKVLQRTMNYELAYADMCAASHSGYATLRYALVREEDGDYGVHFGPMDPDSKSVVLSTAVFLSLCSTVTVECRISGFETDFEEVWKSIREKDNSGVVPDVL